MSYYAVISKVIAESLLSLYPIFVKKIGLNIPIQLWTRLLAYVIIASFFINKSFILQSITSYHAVLLALINLSHIYFSYMGFRYLDSGVSFALFNTYPFMILAMSRAPWHNAYLLAFIGFAAFIYDNYIHGGMKEEDENKEINSCSDPTIPFHQSFGFGTLMILLSAFTEALIYFLVRRVKTENHWNHLFISYFLGAIIMSIYMIYYFMKQKSGEEREVKEVKEVKEVREVREVREDFELKSSVTSNQRILIALGLNGILGALGYYLRFYANYNLNAQIYSILSYVGIIMAYVYGIVLNNESLTIYKVFGTLCIIVANYLILKK
jgi:drug/metabolite transporter (DMT)-like permease